MHKSQKKVVPLHSETRKNNLSTISPCVVWVVVMKKALKNFSIYSTIKIWDDVNSYLSDEFGYEEGSESFNKNMALDYYVALLTEAKGEFMRTLKKIQHHVSQMGGAWLCVGTARLWDGLKAAGTVVDYLDNFIDKISDGADEVEVYTENGKLYVKKYHHDGVNIFECKILTNYGLQAYDDWLNGWRFTDIERERDMHDKLYKSKWYSQDAHYEKYYYEDDCCKKMYLMEKKNKK